MKDYFIGNGTFIPSFDAYKDRFGVNAERCYLADCKTYMQRKNGNYFTLRHKSLAYSMSPTELKRAYKKSERELVLMAKQGNEAKFKSAMVSHSNYEYAMLFQLTPEFKKNMEKEKEHV